MSTDLKPGDKVCDRFSKFRVGFVLFKCPVTDAYIVRYPGCLCYESGKDLVKLEVNEN